VSKGADLKETLYNPIQELKLLYKDPRVFRPVLGSLSRNAGF
jgi:hypothetical protein